MHPLLARYLDVDTTLQAIERIDRGEALMPEERPLEAVLRRAPEQKAAVLAAKGKRHLEDAVQQALVYLAANAAVEQLRDDPATVPAIARADLALRAQGASDAQVSALLATVLIEEAFGYEEDADVFDRPLVIETLETIPALAGLDADRIEQLREKLAGVAGERQAERAQHAFDVLLETAWSEGPEPINREHVAEALAVFDDARDRAQLEPVLRFLAAEGLIGARRLATLLEVAKEA